MTPYLTGLREKLDYLPEDQLEQVCNAFLFAEAAHDGQYRRSGDPYITHPLAVANILADMRMDPQSVMAALLHDVIEDTPISKEEIAERFGEVVADLVDGVSKISAIKFEDRAQAQAENFQKMVLAMTKDIRVILVKLADRLHNMRTLGVLNPQKKRRIATETLEIYAPIANRLGMNNVRVEFEDLGFGALYPMRATNIKKAVKAARGNRKELLKTIEQALQDRLAEENIDARIISREKHLYSIYQKMRKQNKAFDQIMDVYGFRIVVNNVDSCYRTLGVIHNLYKPVPGRFKDYIAIPKANGYQSLHTTLKGISGVPIEIQIRTEAMDAMANNGIAAHWLYKNEADPAKGAQSRARQWLKGLLEMQQAAGDSLEFIENVKIDLFPDEVYVFTPKGNILELPHGATPVDFAYAVHTDIGNQCVAAKLDNRLSPLSVPIQSGQTVEIITAPGAQPNPAWLNYVITGKARSNIRHYLKNKQRSESVDLGHRLLNKALAAMESDMKKISHERITQLLEESGFNTMDDLMEDIGLGNRMAAIVARRLIPTREEEVTLARKSWSKQRPLEIHGTEGMVINYGKCCHPIPGDEVVGHLSSGRGMVVHVHTCRNIKQELKNSPEKCLPVSWAGDITGEFNANLRVEMENKRGVLAALATTISDADSNIEAIHMGEQDARLSVVNFTLAVKDRIHLARIIKKIRANKAVIKITRVRG